MSRRKAQSNELQEMHKSQPNPRGLGAVVWRFQVLDQDHHQIDAVRITVQIASEFPVNLASKHLRGIARMIERGHATVTQTPRG